MEDLKKDIEIAMSADTDLIYNGRKLEGYDKSAARIAVMLLDKALGGDMGDISE